MTSLRMITFLHVRVDQVPPDAVPQLIPKASRRCCIPIQVDSLCIADSLSEMATRVSDILSYWGFCTYEFIVSILLVAYQ